MRITAATRGSPLARWQADRVASLLEAAHPGVTVEPIVVHTSGDLDQTTPIEELGGRGVFAKEVQRAVLDGRADLAVHSAKDLTSTPPEGLTIAAFPERADVRDALVGAALRSLAPGATVATGSIRRRAQLLALRPDLTVVGLRGNMATRVAKVGEVDAIVAAAAGLDRLGWADRIAERLDPAIFVPQVAQGALAVECRADDEVTIDLLGAIDDPAVRRPVSAERAYLAELGGGCELPVGALAHLDDDDVVIDALLAGPGGAPLLRVTERGADPAAVGVAAARRLLEDGGRELLG